MVGFTLPPVSHQPVQHPSRSRCTSPSARGAVLTRPRYITYGPPQFKKNADPMHLSRASLWCRRRTTGSEARSDPTCMRAP